MWSANLCHGRWGWAQGLLHSSGLHSSTRSNRPQCASMVSLSAVVGHAHRVDAKVRKAAADRSNRQGNLDLTAARCGLDLPDKLLTLGDQVIDEQSRWALFAALHESAHGTFSSSTPAAT